MPQPIRGGITKQSETLLNRLRDSVDPRAAGMRRIVAEMEAASAKLEASIKEGWPVDRNTRGNPTRGDHSVDDIEVRTVLHPTKIVSTVYSTSTYGYYIRSVMVGETDAQQRKRHRWRDGTSADRYNAQRHVGRKRHAFTVLFRTPGRKAGRLLARELQADLVDLMKKVI
jgi:hypothetical protein